MIDNIWTLFTFLLDPFDLCYPDGAVIVAHDGNGTYFNTYFPTLGSSKHFFDSLHDALLKSSYKTDHRSYFLWKARYEAINNVSLSCARSPGNIHAPKEAQ